MIFHLSYSFKQSGIGSINELTPQEKCTVKYRDIEHVVESSFVWRGQQESGTVVYLKTDVKSAFHLLPLKKNCWHLLIFKARNPEPNQMKIFVEKNLPFGASISCSHFQHFSCAI